MLQDEGRVPTNAQVFLEGISFTWGACEVSQVLPISTTTPADAAQQLTGLKLQKVSLTPNQNGNAPTAPFANAASVDWSSIELYS